jgi:histidyl-tRNA synthetase
MAKYRAVRGTKDLLPSEIARWDLMESRAAEIFARYGFREIRTPILESYDLFVRSVGEGTDIVNKEMYVFERGRERVALRPENTAPVVRAFLEHALQHDASASRLYYVGPQFRYERPQKGRLRQFHQIGAEVLGEDSPRVDAEVIGMVMEYLGALRLPDLSLRLNSVGDATCRPGYRAALCEYLEPRLPDLCADCRRRYDTNPLRVFDCKVEADRETVSGAPRMVDSLCEPCGAHFVAVQEALGAAGVRFELDPRLVRGLDYYVRTAFEVVSPALGAQDAVLGGGRYDGLVESLGGPATPGFGFAIGLERVALLLPEDHADLAPGGIDLFLVGVGDRAQERLPGLARELRAAGCSVLHDYRGRSLGAQMRRANRLGARLSLILGEEELGRDSCVLKRMADGVQEEIPLGDLTPKALLLLGRGGP